MTRRKKTVGVIVGRFQVPNLHIGHRFLFDFVKARHDTFVVIVGASSFANRRNPLSFEMRRDMIAKSYPEAIVLELKDRRSDTEWCEALDRMLSETFAGAKVTLYGSRDSFIPMYTGGYKTEVLPEVERANGTDERARIAKNPIADEAFRAGIIYAHENRMPTGTATVDVGVVDWDRGVMLLGAKDTDGDKWRFIGGLVDPEIDESIESAARREQYEETTGMAVEDFRYIGSKKIHDWRIVGCKDANVTSVFLGTYVFGPLRPGDDIVRLEWFPIEKAYDALIDDHKPIFDMMLPHIERERAAREVKQAA